MNTFEIVLYIIWMTPIVTLCTIVYGYVRSRLCFKSTYNTKKIIIQITTIGNYNTVNKIISAIRSYNLSIPYEIWVVTESALLNKYEDADRILKVPDDFQSISKYKARALDYSSQVRKSMGQTGDDIKVLYLDDDTIPSKKYVEKCFIGDYDIMEGIIQPKLNYGNKYSYVENMRTISCMNVCSIFQSHGHPVWVHGEGICVKASTEQKVGWKFNAIASEDLIFGHTCATKNMKWGFIWETIYTTAPWSLRDFFKQRNRWFWGHVHAISNILTWKSIARVLSYRIFGMIAFWLSTVGMVMDLIGMVKFDALETITFFISLACWLGIYGYVGYVVGDGKLRHIILSVVLAWYTSFMNMIATFVSFYLGRPKKFEVIEKERKMYYPSTDKKSLSETVLLATDKR